MRQQGRSKALVGVSRELDSVYALRLGCQLGRLGGLGLELMHVIESDPLPRGAGWAPHSWARERESELRRELGQMVEAVGDFCDVDPEIAFAEGRARDELLSTLRRGEHDMVIVGGRRGSGAGGVLRHLARSSPVPVLVARGYRPLRRVLICSDGSAAAAQTLGFIARLLGNSTLETTLLSLTDDGEQAVRTLEAEGVDARLVTAPGGGLESVLAEAAQGDYDLLVLAKAEHSVGLREFFLGSDALLQAALHAPCPVLIQPRGV